MRENFGNDVLIKAVNEGDATKVGSILYEKRCFLFKTGDIVESLADPGGWAFAAAVIQGNRRIVEIFISEKSPVNQVVMQPDDSIYPLNLAVMHGQHAVANLLISYGADVNASNSNGSQREAGTPLRFAVMYKRHSILRLLIKKGADLTAVSRKGHPNYVYILHEAAHTQDFEIIKTLIASGAPLTPLNSSGHTPMHAAAFAGNSKMCELLVRAGADVDCRCKQQSTALHTAARNNMCGVITTLLDLGADINATDSANQTPIHQASQTASSFGALKMLTFAGARLDIPDRDGDFVLNMALRMWNRDMALFLMCAGAYTNDRANRGPFVDACGKDNKGKICVFPHLPWYNPKYRLFLTLVANNEITHLTQ